MKKKRKDKKSLVYRGKAPVSVGVGRLSQPTFSHQASGNINPPTPLLPHYLLNSVNLVMLPPPPPPPPPPLFLTSLESPTLSTIANNVAIKPLNYGVTLAGYLYIIDSRTLSIKFLRLGYLYLLLLLFALCSRSQ